MRENTFGMKFAFILAAKVGPCGKLWWIPAQHPQAWGPLRSQPASKAHLDLRACAIRKSVVAKVFSGVPLSDTEVKYRPATPIAGTPSIL